MATYPRVPLDLPEYEREVRAASTAGSCFICAIVAGERDDHFVLFRDDTCIAFFAKWPTLLGYTLVAPLDHRTDAVGSFTEDEYAKQQYAALMHEHGYLDIPAADQAALADRIRDRIAGQAT